jgi:hypothetical protein
VAAGQQPQQALAEGAVAAGQPLPQAVEAPAGLGGPLQEQIRGRRPGFLDEGGFLTRRGRREDPTGGCPAGRWRGCLEFASVAATTPQEGDETGDERAGDDDADDDDEPQIATVVTPSPRMVTP